MHLFSETGFHDYRRAQVAAMEDEISSLDSAELDSSTDSLALIFARKYGHSPIEVHDPIKEDGGEVDKDVSDDPRRVVFDRSTPTYKTARRIEVKLPYRGQKDLFDIQPTTYDFNPPRVDKISYQYILFYVDFFEDTGDAEEIQSEIDTRVAKIEKYVDNLNDDLRKLTDKLEQVARSALKRRRDTLETKQGIMDKLGVDRGADKRRGFVKPEKKREIDLDRTASASSAAVEILQEETFLDLLGITDDLGMNIERAASRVRDLDEESLRDVFLAGINSHYKGLATGETFNRKGKTDILLRYKNENLFVAECKFWKGQSAYQDTIDQLLGYLTVRDSYTAVLIFSQRADFQAVEEKMHNATKKHDRYVTKLSEYSDHAVYRFEQGAGAPVKIAAQVFDLSQ